MSIRIGGTLRRAHGAVDAESPQAKEGQWFFTSQRRPSGFLLSISACRLIPTREVQ
jgi:hypothetical protein